ncbi:MULTISPECIES: amidohydrolase family protein [Halorussus]|uniref:amidohydrolase family protein n=1 Tax=Halorussus TaxID=1070314 RepID=UPI000E21221B|nr:MULTISPECIES: amidohydrolase family protein [Halorussus]NHN59046.1 amidohydrolase [Halorussus sp. JP-T4]
MPQLDVVADHAEDYPVIDTHCHQPTEEFLVDAGGQMMRDAAEKFGAEMETDTYDHLIEEYRDCGIGRAVLLGWDAETNTGNPPVPNDYVAEVRDEYDDFFVGFASVDPLKDDCVAEAERAVEDLDLSGFKFQQIAQGFDPSDPEHDELWDTIEDLGVPVVFHGGSSTLGAGAPGGRGLKIKYGDPMMIDDVAAEHPDLQILLAHPAFPWEKEQLAICQQKGNVYMDLSGWMPRYIDDQVLHYAKTLLRDKVMFGTDYPMIDPAAWLDQFAELDFSEDVQRKILWENAEQFLGL